MIGLGARIAAARAHANLSQATLGHRLGVGQTCVSYWEKDKREPGLPELIALAAELGVTLAHLAGTDTSEAESYWVGFRAGWLACANSVTAAAALRPDRMPPHGTPMPPEAQPLRAFGLRHRNLHPVGLLAERPYTRIGARDPIEAWQKLTQGPGLSQMPQPCGTELVSRASAGDEWRVVWVVGEDGALAEPEPQAGESS